MAIDATSVVAESHRRIADCFDACIYCQCRAILRSVLACCKIDKIYSCASCISHSVRGNIARAACIDSTMNCCMTGRVTTTALPDRSRFALEELDHGDCCRFVCFCVAALFALGSIALENHSHYSKNRLSANVMIRQTKTHLADLDARFDVGD